MFKSNTLIKVSYDLLTAQVFKTHIYHINYISISIHGLYLIENKRILTLLKKHETGLVIWLLAE